MSSNNYRSFEDYLAAAGAVLHGRVKITKLEAKSAEGTMSTERAASQERAIDLERAQSVESTRSLERAQRRGEYRTA